MRKGLLSLALAIFIALVGPASGYAQEENSAPEHAKAEQTKTVHAYRVDFAVSELEDGKKVNTRRYSTDINAGEGQQIKIGTRVPVATSSFSGEGKDANQLVNTQFQYIDVGTTILCRLEERGDEVGLNVNSDFSNFSTREEQHTSQPILKQPIIRQIKITGSTLATPGKTVLIGSVDDPNSNREFQLEATVTKLR